MRIFANTNEPHRLAFGTRAQIIRKERVYLNLIELMSVEMADMSYSLGFGA